MQTDNFNSIFGTVSFFEISDSSKLNDSFTEIYDENYRDNVKIWNNQKKWIYISFVFVDPLKRDKGNGTKLMKEFMSNFPDAGFVLDPLEVKDEGITMSDTLLVSWYKKLGFRTIKNSCMTLFK